MSGRIMVSVDADCCEAFRQLSPAKVACPGVDAASLWPGRRLALITGYGESCKHAARACLHVPVTR